MTYASAIDDPHRSRRSRDIGPHFGLVPKRHQSGEIDRSERITKNGVASVRTALYEAAAHIMLTQVSGFSVLKTWALRLVARSNARVAKIALARKLTVILHRIWLDGTVPWKPTPQHSTTGLVQTDVAAHALAKIHSEHTAPLSVHI